MFVCSYRHCQVENVLPKKAEIPKIGWFKIMKRRGYWGVAHSRISEGKGGGETWKLSVVGYGYFLELPNQVKLQVFRIQHFLYVGWGTKLGR